MEENLKVLKILLDKQALYYRSLSNEEIKALSEIQKDLEKKYGKVKTKTDDKIYSIKEKVKNFVIKMIEKNGKNKQVLVSVEEMQELSKELLKNVNRDVKNRKEILEELADVLLMSMQLITIYNIDGEEIEKVWEEKIKRVIDNENKK